MPGAGTKILGFAGAAAGAYYLYSEYGGPSYNGKEDMSGKVFILTGATGPGVGKEAAREFAKRVSSKLLGSSLLVKASPFNGSNDSAHSRETEATTNLNRMSADNGFQAVSESSKEEPTPSCLIFKCKSFVPRNRKLVHLDHVLQPGDLVEVSRSKLGLLTETMSASSTTTGPAPFVPWDHNEPFPTANDRYNHWGIYIGDGYIVNVSSDSLGIFQVKKELLLEVVMGDPWRVNNLEHCREVNYISVNVDDAIKRAVARIGEKIKYHAVWNNCEHFVTECRFNKKYSGQHIATAQTWSKRAIYAIAVVTVIAISVVSRRLLRRAILLSKGYRERKGK